MSDTKRLQAEIDALREYNRNLRAQNEYRRQQNCRLGGREAPLTAAEAPVFALTVALQSAHAESGFNQRAAKVAKRREKGTLVDGWDGSWVTAKSGWQEVEAAPATAVVPVPAKEVLPQRAPKLDTDETRPVFRPTVVRR